MGEFMKIVHMIEDYGILCNEAKNVGKFEAYENYTKKYPAFFQSVFRFLYCQPIERLKPMIEQTDFKNLLQVAENNYKQGTVDYTILSAKRFVERMNVDFEFTFLLGLELSNIGGCALPDDEYEPNLYIGIDRPLSKDQIDILIPHEIIHMVRHHTVKDGFPDTVLSRAVEEGLASYATLWIHNPEWNVANVAKTLNVSEAQADNLMKNTAALTEKLLSDGDAPISSETMREYFTSTSVDDDFPVKGYYLGLYFTHLSVKNGTEFEKLIFMPKEKIADIWLTDFIRY